MADMSMKHQWRTMAHGTQRRLAGGVIAAAVAVHGAASEALAQKIAIPTDEDGGAMSWLIAAGIIVVVCLSAFINPKRSHLN